ncbi:MAG: prepilin peptidase [Peptococcaceae bacterium]|nr:prepilin peptidase [Peptococcaceae bacterium]
MTLTVLLVILLTGSVYTDLRQRVIKNILVFPIAFLALALHTFTDGMPGFLFGLKGLLVGLFMLFIPYLIIGGLGEGDVKLMAAVGAITGPHFAMWAAFYAAMVGALIGIAISIKEGRMKEVFSFTFNHSMYIAGKYLSGDFSKTEVDGGTTIPYAVAVAAGVLITGITLGWWA